MSFEQFELDPRILAVLEKQNILSPTPVQEQAIPIAMTGSDVVAVAQTGTGKTLGFTLPSLTRLAQDKLNRNAMLILVPTRELCTQVQSVVKDIGAPLGIQSVAIYGGVSIDDQTKDLKKGMNVVVATPGRLLDHLSRRNLNFDNLSILVLDEADRMLDMGFLPDLKRIIAQLPKQRQTLMFSATFPDQISRLAATMMTEPERVVVGTLSTPVDTVRQIIYAVKPEDKIRLLLEVLEGEDVTATLIFFRTRDRTEQIGNVLNNRNYSVSQIHGDRTQKQRQEALDGFRSGKFKILVATDVAARGLDIEGVTHVINFDIPPTVDDYIHRIGRTARAEAEGDAITFVTPTEFQALGTIERALGENLPRVDWEGAPRLLTLFHPPGSKGARAARRRGGGRRGRRR